MAAVKWVPWYVKMRAPVEGLKGGLKEGCVYPVDVYRDSVQARLPGGGDIQIFESEYVVLISRPLVRTS